MFKLETPRYLLVQTPLHVALERLKRDAFQADVPVGDETLRVTFPPEWPGDALALFPMMAEQLREAPETTPWGGTIIDRAEQVAVGQMGFKGLPDASGMVEIGYGVNPSYQGKGCATEVAVALSDWALEQHGVTRVTAECLDDNSASIRVLEKVGFRRVGTCINAEEGGTLIVWERTL